MQFEKNEELWNLMGEIPVPEPSSEMQVNFNAMLESYKASEGETGPSVMAGLICFWRLFRAQPWIAAAFSLILIAGGFGIGYMARRPAMVIVSSVSPLPPTVQKGERGDTVQRVAPDVAQRKAGGTTGRRASGDASQRRRLQALTTQVHEMGEMVMMALLQNPSASERMRAVSYTNDISTVSPDILAALLTTLNNDPNVNVRLTTLDALTQYARNPAVREGLIQSILQQESPLMQAALADVMLKLQEKRSVQAFKKLLQEEGLNEMVRSRIEEVITRLT